MQRRDLIKSLIATTLAASTPGSVMLSARSFASPNQKASSHLWKNWSGNQQCSPANKLAPANIAELQKQILSSNDKIRAVGSGHSFSELVPSQETLLSIRRLNGLSGLNNEQKTATFLAGTTLGETGPLLAKHNQALFNMPDVDHQTLAGAISSATHGTGRELGCLSSFVKQLTLITAQGEEVTCNNHQNHELFNAAKVGLGALGIITEVTMQNRDSYQLQRESFWLDIEETITSANRLSMENRHFEFFYFPFTGMTLVDTLNITSDAIYAGNEIDGNDGILDLKNARDYLSWSPRLRELIVGGYLKTQAKISRIDQSYKIYANDRNVRFNEMEYHLPVENGLSALKDIIATIERDFPEVFFPIECRYIKADDAWLSPFYQQDSFSIAVHRYFEEDYTQLFKAIEPILQSYAGRPHWGKVNTFNTKQCSEMYPKWQTFLDVRQEYDPQGKFLNPYLRRLFSV